MYLFQIEHRTLAAFVLAGIVDNYPAGQEAALQVHIAVSIILLLFNYLNVVFY